MTNSRKYCQDTDQRLFQDKKKSNSVKINFMLTNFCHHVDDIADRPLATQQSNGLSNSARKTILWLFYQKHRKLKYINIFWTISLPTVQFDSFDKLSPTSLINRVSRECCNVYSSLARIWRSAIDALSMSRSN